MATFKTIVAALDFSDMSRDVLHYAARLVSTSPEARILVIHVVPDPLQQSWTVETVGVDFEQLQKDWTADAMRRLQALLPPENLTGASAAPVVLAGRAAETIVRYATEQRADLIVLGTHGHGPVKRFILGSVADRVVRQAASPVLIIPHRGLQEAT
jgi:nucleotide-binding universal stress UspA family protein